VAASEGGGGDVHGTSALTDAELRSLLVDCLRLWEVSGKVVVRDSDLAIETAEGVFTVARAEVGLRPVRWFYQTPERAAAQRPARAAPSIVALLSGLRNAMGGSGGERLRVGGGS
jgi:hypothetical protein